jgi:two-component system nitrate/nitrite sensor histidine kinase NarX
MAISLSTKLGAIGAVLLLMALASIGLTLWVTWQLEGGAAAVNEAGRMRMQTWRLAQTLPSQDGQRLQDQLAQFEQTLSLLRSGDSSRPCLYPRTCARSGPLPTCSRTGCSCGRPGPPARRRVPRRCRSQAEVFVARIDAFVTAIETQLARWTTVLNAFQFVMMALAIGSAVAMLYSAYLFVFNPLSRLQTGLARVGGGDLAARVEVDSSDEFGELSTGFNRMAQTLQGLYQNLEAACARKDAGPGNRTRAPGRPVRSRGLCRFGHPAGNAGPGLCAAGAARGPRRRFGGALVR